MFLSPNHRIFSPHISLGPSLLKPLRKNGQMNFLPNSVGNKVSHTYLNLMKELIEHYFDCNWVMQVFELQLLVLLRRNTSQYTSVTVCLRILPPKPMLEVFNCENTRRTNVHVNDYYWIFKVVWWLLHGYPLPQLECL